MIAGQLLAFSVQVWYLFIKYQKRSEGRRMKNTLFLTLVMLCASCAAQMNWVATGGSRSDGTVKLSYQYGVFQKPVLDESQGLSVASERCSAWGFTHAEAFGGVLTTCNNSDGYGSCNQWLVTKEYQCTD